MDNAARAWTGGCQCGAIRFRAGSLGRASFCHCRMCQKAFGATGGALVTVTAFNWTRGAPKHFQSSNDIRRGFCGACGTPLTFEYKSGFDVAIAAFDRAGEIRPVIQYSPEMALPWTESVTSLPGYPQDEHERRQTWFASIVSHQHPDHETERWTSHLTPECVRAMPVLGVADIGRSLAFYKDKLGFAASTWGEPATFAILQRGTITIALAVAATPAVSRAWAAYLYVTDVDALHGEFVAHGVASAEPPTNQPYNCRDFGVDDPDGHLLAFGQVLEADSRGPGLSASRGRDAS